MKTSPIFFFIFLCTLLLFSSNIEGQSINKTWLSSQNICLEFDSITCRLNVGNYYDSYKVGKQRFEYKVIDNKLKVIWYINQTIFGYQKETSWFKIYELSENKLILVFDGDPKRSGLVELFGGVSTEFSQSGKSCIDF